MPSISGDQASDFEFFRDKGAYGEAHRPVRSFHHQPGPAHAGPQKNAGGLIMAELVVFCFVVGCCAAAYISVKKHRPQDGWPRRRA